MRYLLIGGSGFIGRHLTDKLLSEGHTVTIIDSNFTSSKYDLKNERLHYISCDVTGLTSLAFSSEIEPADKIYFLAGSVGVQHIMNDPYNTCLNNIRLMTAIIPLARKYNKPIYFTSTSEVYGEGPFVEDSQTLSVKNPTDTRWSYAIAKLMTESLIVSSGVKYKIFRLFNVTGPGQLPDYGMVIPRFVTAAKNNKPIEVYNEGSAVRTFCHIKDCVEMFYRCEQIETNEIINIGAPPEQNSITMIELANKVCSIVGQTEIIHKPFNVTDIQNRVPNVNKLLSIIGDYKFRTVDEIIEDMK